jgi:hypothetical protein
MKVAEIRTGGYAVPMNVNSNSLDLRRAMTQKEELAIIHHSSRSDVPSIVKAGEQDFTFSALNELIENGLVRSEGRPNWYELTEYGWTDQAASS